MAYKAKPKKDMGLNGDVFRSYFKDGEYMTQEFIGKGSKAEKPDWSQKKHHEHKIESLIGGKKK